MHCSSCTVYSVTVILATAFIQQSVSDECTDAINIGNAHRSMKYETPVAALALCDDELTIDEGQWYRFDSHTGDRLVEGTDAGPPCSVEQFRCGTHAPIYMVDKHPTGFTAVTAEVCASYNQEDCCSWRREIKVKRCNGNPEDYFVYQLKPVDGCSVAYCAGTGIACANLEIWDGAKCIPDVPPNITAVELSKPFVPDNAMAGEGFKFECIIETEEASKNARFTVQWLADTLMFKEEVLIPPQTVATITESMLYGKLGQRLQCKVVAWFLEGKNKMSVKSETYWMGIQGPSYLIVIKEDRDETKQVQLTSTLPITCEGKRKFLQGQKCPLYFYVNVPKTKIKTSGNDACQVTFHSEAQTMNIPLNVLGDISRSKAIQTYMSVTAEKSGIKQYGIWSEYKVPNILIQIQDSVNAAKCSSTGDPHYTTFDGNYFHIYDPGYFLLVKSDLDSLFEVHTITRICRTTVDKGTISCNCAVAVREGNTIYGINVCSGTLITFVRYVDTNPAGAIYSRNGKQFTIVMPSGTTLTAKVSGSVMHIYVYIPSKYKFHTEGLCGSYDGDKTNDLKLRKSDVIDTLGEKKLPKKFTESYRIQNITSLFNDEYPLCSDKITQVRHCSCKAGNEVYCEFRENPEENIVEFGIRCPEVVAGTRKKRAVPVLPLSLAEKLNDPGYTDNPSDINEVLNDTIDNTPSNKTVDITWRTKTGITEQQAETKCDNLLQMSPTFQYCEDQVNLTEYKMSCTIDINLLDDLTASDYITSAMESDCAFEIEANMVKGSPSEAAQQQLLNNVKNNICPDLCSGQGTCQNGVCNCYSEYIGEDCAIKRGVPPNMTSLETSVCDMQQRPCRNIRVQATPLTDILDLKCRIKHVQLSSDGNHITTKTEYVIGKLLSYMKVMCPIPPTPVSPLYTKGEHTTEHGLYIAVTNDGANYSEEKLLVVYDSMCRDCSENGLCTMKTGTCSLEGECYSGIDCTACTHAIDIGNPKRSTAYQPSANKSKICDQSIQNGQWYKFSAYTGDMMAESCVLPNHCGTTAPVWLQDGHPLVKKQIFKGTVCSNLGEVSNDCCVWNKTIQIRWCDMTELYYVYKLVSVPQCDMGYCSGYLVPCAATHEWREDLSKCIPLCNAGSVYNTSTDTCEMCPVGQYRTILSTVCDHCPSGFTTYTKGATTQADCNTAVCAKGKYSDGPACKPCLDGYYQDTGGSTSCIACPGGQNKVSTNGTGAVSSTQCYNTDECSLNKHDCKPASHGGSCIDLPKWDFSCVCMVGWSGSHPDCILICPDGQGYNAGSNQCEVCPKGTYKGPGDAECMPCNTGLTTTGTGKTHANDCNLGFCNAGYYAVGTICTLCADGQYQSANGTTECIPCGPNLDEVTTNGTGATSLSQCQSTNECGLGIHNCRSSSGEALCLDLPKWGYKCEYTCPAGTHNENGGSTCLKCVKGTYRADSDTACINCPTGTTTSGTGSTSDTHCHIAKCDKGHYANGLVCHPCSEGFYQDEAESVSCKPCGDNLDAVSTNGTAATSKSTCYNTNECETGAHTCGAISHGFMCHDLPKWGYRCECVTRWSGVHPNCIPPWNPWSAWTGCIMNTPNCGSGYRLRSRTCSSEVVQCVGSNNEYKLCQFTPCADPKKIILVWIIKDALPQVVENLDVIESGIKLSVSNYCSENPDDGCQSLGLLKYRNSVPSLNWVRNVNIQIYNEDATGVSLTMNITINEQQAKQLCTGSIQSFGDIMFPGNLIENAVMNKKKEIKMNTGIEIIKLNYTNPTTTTTANPITVTTTLSTEAVNNVTNHMATDQQKSNSMWIIVGVCLSVAIAAVLAVVLGIALHHHKQSVKHRRQRSSSNSQTLNQYVPSVSRTPSSVYNTNQGSINIQRHSSGYSHNPDKQNTYESFRPGRDSHVYTPMKYGSRKR